VATERDIRAAERARLQALVDELGSEAERNALLISAWRDGLPDGELLVRLARRAQLRAKLGLAADECGGDPPTHSCTCLVRALDESSTGSKRAILSRARGFHWSPQPRRERVEPVPELAAAPREAVAAPTEANGRVQAGTPPHVRDRDITASDPVFRPVRRRPKWYDPRPGSFRDMQF
jgi:hypothetical protein